MTTPPPRKTNRMGHAPFVQCSVRFSGPTTHPQSPYVICLWSLIWRLCCSVGMWLKSMRAIWVRSADFIEGMLCVTKFPCAVRVIQRDKPTAPVSINWKNFFLRIVAGNGLIQWPICPSIEFVFDEWIGQWIDRLIDWLIDSCLNKEFVLLIDWLICFRPSGSLVTLLIAWLHGLLIAWLLGALIVWLLGALIVWLLGALIAWLHGPLIAWLEWTRYVHKWNVFSVHLRLLRRKKTFNRSWKEFYSIRFWVAHFFAVSSRVYLSIINKPNQLEITTQRSLSLLSLNNPVMCFRVKFLSISADWIDQLYPSRMWSIFPKNNFCRTSIWIFFKEIFFSNKKNSKSFKIWKFFQIFFKFFSNFFQIFFSKFFFNFNFLKKF